MSALLFSGFSAISIIIAFWWELQEHQWQLKDDMFIDCGWIITHRLGNPWSGWSQGAKEADMGGDSNTSSAIEYNSSWASTYAAEVIEFTEEKEEQWAAWHHVCLRRFGKYTLIRNECSTSHLHFAALFQAATKYSTIVRLSRRDGKGD